MIGAKDMFDALISTNSSVLSSEILLGEAGIAR